MVIKYTKLSPPLPKKNKTKQAFRNNYILHNHIPDLAAAATYLGFNSQSNLI
jgi:hypothetical protein